MPPRLRSLTLTSRSTCRTELVTEFLSRSKYMVEAQYIVKNISTVEPS